MSGTAADDELAPTQTEGYKVGEKKTVEEYSKLGAPSPVLILEIPQLPSTPPRD